LATASDRSALLPHEVILSSTVQSAVSLQAWGKFAGDADLNVLVVALRTRVTKVQDGDMQPVEAILFSQAVTLETIFTNLARRAAMNAGEYLNATDTYMRLAFKAQAQCRATLEALAEIKNPRPVLIAKQANLSNGPQQVNNGVQPAQQAASAQGGGGVKSLAGPETEAARYPTGTTFSLGAENQMGGSTTQVV
jgi:hypothetical protein